MLNLWKREDLVHNAGVKTEQVIAEGSVDFAHEMFAYWNYWGAMGLHEVTGWELSYVI